MTKEEAIMVLKNEHPHCGKKALFPEEKKYEAFNVAIAALEAELATKTCNKQIASKLEDAELARDSEETCNNKQVISKLVASEDAISREAVISIIEESKEDDTDEWMGYPWKVTPNLLMDEVRKLPPVTPKQRTGHWIKSPNDFFATCSECGLHGDKGIFKHYRWCPICGAKMVEPQESEEQE